MSQKSTTHSDKTGSLSDDELRIKSVLNQHLDSEVEDLDFNVTSRLTAARHRALDQGKSNSAVGKGWFTWPVASLGVATMVFALVMGGRFYPPESLQLVPETIVADQSVLMEDLTLLTASDDIEFYQSIEFLEWMESNSS